MLSPADALTVEELDLARLSEIEPLWVQLNAHHHDQSPAFRSAYASRTWFQRRAELLDKAHQGHLLILVARNALGLVAYCVTSVSQSGVGELDSLFVSDSARNNGLGHTLVTRALAWMDRCGARTKRVVVYSGNERAQGLYARFGFVPRQVVMELPSDPVIEDR